MNLTLIAWGLVIAALLTWGIHRVSAHLRDYVVARKVNKTLNKVNDILDRVKEREQEEQSNE